MLLRPARLGLLLLALAAGAAAGCAGSQEARDDGDRPARPARTEGLRLAPPADRVGTVQLFRSGDQANLPVVTLGTGQTLQLAFDLFEERGSPVSVYFYHADREWRRDLVPAEYMASFYHDQVLDYAISGATRVPYVHYSYRFPNDDIQFLVSGNYIVRVAEQGDEEAVLFERPFFVTEQVAPLEVGVNGLLVNGPFASDQPIASFVPPPAIQADVYDYAVCFVRNGRIGQQRCTDRPQLIQQPALQFYLDAGDAFEPETADYFMDLTNLRVSNRIVDTDFSASPFEVVLEPDYARFAGTGLEPLLNGQPVVGAVAAASPATGAEYVRVRFTYVPPDERRLVGDVVVAGAFNGWVVRPENRMLWVPERARYEGHVLVKQGRYEYRYYTRDQSRALASAMPRPQNAYAAFVYYNDIRTRTDRLLAVQNVLTN